MPEQPRLYHTAGYVGTGLYCVQTFITEGNTVGLYRVIEDGKVKLFNTNEEAQAYAKTL
jgi:hypothetical protein